MVSRFAIASPLPTNPAVMSLSNPCTTTSSCSVAPWGSPASSSSAWRCSALRPGEHHCRVPGNHLQREAICCVLRANSACCLACLLTGRGLWPPTCPTAQPPELGTPHRRPALGSCAGCGDVASRLAAPALLPDLPSKGPSPNIINLRHSPVAANAYVQSVAGRARLCLQAPVGRLSGVPM
jgi:hypothetical protein